MLHLLEGYIRTKRRQKKQKKQHQAGFEPTTFLFSDWLAGTLLLYRSW